MAINRVQVRRTLPWVDPIDAAALLPEGLLLDGRGGHPEARFAFMGLHPILEARFEGDTLTLRGAEETRRTGAPIDLLRALVDAYHWDLGEAHPFTGGFVGYFGYGFTAAIEPTLPRHASDTPDALLHLCTDALVFEHATQTLTAYAADVDRIAAEARLDELVGRLQQDLPSPRAVATPTWTPSLDQESFEAAVATMRQHILEGDLFQANIATQFEAELDADPVDLLRAFQAGNPSPYMALLRYADHAVISSSPEQLLAVDAGRIRTRPIAGTRGRGQDEAADQALEAELRADPKERAEHTMLVDLLRNDIAKVCAPGTTRVTELLSVERYQHVMHLVSCVEGRLRTDTGFPDWLAALFPGGTITGAPKHRACLRIHEAEPVARGPYTGSAGFLSWSHNAHWNILIRTLVLRDGRARVHAGSGIVADSDPSAEWHEANRKARSLLRAGGTPRSDAGSVRTAGTWSPHEPSRRVAARVLLIDNYDSFVHNLADYAAACGATVRVVRNDEDLEAAVADFAPTHLILGPGPGRPEASGATLEAARQVGRWPMLGVCLGHQAMAIAHGGKVRIAPPVHGKTSPVHHEEPLFDGLPHPFTATRYHSLVVDAPPSWHVTAQLEDGTVMAMRHPEHPVWGLQFHPESVLTEGGMDIVLAFLEASP